MLIIYHYETGKNSNCSISFQLCSISFQLCSISFQLCSISFQLCSISFQLCSILSKKSNILVFDIFFGVLKLILGYLLLRLPIKVLTSSIIHLQCHLFWHQIRKFYKNNQKLAIFFTWSFHEVLNLDFLVSVNFLYMLLSFKKISFGVQFYKHRRVGFIPIVMNQVYKSLRGAMASLSLSQKCIFFSKPTIFSSKMCKILFWF